MNKTQMELESIVDSYFAELMSSDDSVLNDYTPSIKYLNQKEVIFRSFDRSKIKLSIHLRRKAIIALIAAVMIGTIAAFAITPSRRYILSFFPDHTDVTVSVTDSEADGHKTKIERKYSITVPEGYSLDSSSSVETDEMICCTYYNSDHSKTILFDQMVLSQFNISIDNESIAFVSKIDKNGQEILVHNYDDRSVLIIWDDGEYVFRLSGEMSEAELMEIYYSVNVK